MLGDDLLFGLFTTNSLGLVNHFNQLQSPDYSAREIERLQQQFSQADDKDSQQIATFLSAGMKFLAQSTLDAELAEKRNAHATDRQLMTCLNELTQAFETIQQHADSSSENEVYAQCIDYMQTSITKRLEQLAAKQDRLFTLYQSSGERLLAQIEKPYLAGKQPK